MESDNQTVSSPESDPPDYNDVIPFEESPLYQAVVNVDVALIRHLLDLDYNALEIGHYGQTLLHALLYSLLSQPSDSECWSSQDRLRVVYMLTNAGTDINAKDNYDLTVLQYAVQCNDAQLCDVLLQCGADMFVLEEHEISLYDSVVFSGSDTDDNCNSAVSEISTVFKKYQPGLWHAVVSENLTAVRRLVNLWCKTDLQQNDKTLLDLAIVDTGNEGIISLLSAVIPSMRLVHHVLGGDVRGVQQLLNSDLRSKIHINLKNLGFRAAPILFFVIRGKNLEILREFKKNGCSIVTHMSDETDCEMPVLFSALQSDMPADIITELLPDPEKDQFHLLEHLAYKGKHILQVALENDVVEGAIGSILQKGGARLVCTRNTYNRTPRDWALNENKMHYVDLIDSHVVQWVVNSNQYPGRRETLALWGYEHIADVTYKWMEQNSLSVGDIPPQVLQFLEGLDMYQEQIAELAEAIETDDLVAFKDKILYPGNGPFEHELYWDGRVKGDGLPLLHRAVLNNNFPIASLILWQWEKRRNSAPVDSLRDQNQRTALHYTSGMEQASEMCVLLHRHGCSEHTLDKDGREPLDFTEVQGTPAMTALINRIKLNNNQSPEPNPWDHEILSEIRRRRALRCLAVTAYACESCKWTRFQPVLRSRSFPVFKMLSLHKPIPHCQTQVIPRIKDVNLTPRKKLNLNLTRLMQNDTLSEQETEQSDLDTQSDDDDSNGNFEMTKSCDKATSTTFDDCPEKWEDQEEHLLPNKQSRTNERSCTFL